MKRAPYFSGLAMAVFCLAPVLLVQPAQSQSIFDSAKSLLGKTLGGSDSGDAATVGGLTTSEIADGLKQALEVGTEIVSANLGATDGFNADPAIHIPLPPDLQNAQKMLEKVGLGSLGEEVELKMNRAAEAAMKDSGDIVIKAVQAMTLDDAKGILQGPDNAATTYLQRVAGDDIRAKIRPIVEQALSEVGAIAAADRMVADYSKLPFVPDVKGDLTAHATEKAYDGLFHYIAQEEASIRENPTKRTTDLLKKVFAQQ